MEYVCINDHVIYRIGNSYWRGYIIDFFKYNHNVCAKVKFNNDYELTFPLSDFKRVGNYLTLYIDK